MYKSFKGTQLLNNNSQGGTLMKRIFVSLGFSGRSETKIMKDIQRAYDALSDTFDSEIVIVHNYFCERPDGDRRRLYYLGEAIKLLGECDACYFVKGWENYHGCRIEHEVCEQYGIEMIYEN